MKIKKDGQFKLSDISENENIQYYSGSENPIYMVRFYNQKFFCDFKMYWYPFDVQKCRLRMTMKRAYDPFTELVVDKIAYEGDRMLTKYEVKDVIMKLDSQSKKQELYVEVVLGRQLLSIIMNVFVPTLVLNIISYSTNFYKDEYFESVIAINLTSMLVLVALFVSVSFFRSLFT